MSPKANKTAETPVVFEKILEDLEGIVGRLEDGDLPLEESLAVFERGIRLAREGSKRLDEAEARVEALLMRDGEAASEPLSIEES